MSSDILFQLYIFILAIFVGFEVITKVPPTLHTPLMSGSNAISGIKIVGAIIASGYKKITIESFFGDIDLTVILGFIAIIFATINVFGGFLVTNRMLRMFKK